jgi:glucosylglycerate synthase
VVVDVEAQSTLSDELLRQLMAVGQVDILVGLPTLNNAASVVDVARAVYLCFTRDFPRLRTVMINSDAGSTDGTPELIRHAKFTEGDMLQTSHSLRTLHRVVTPYHGLPGKHTALRTLFAAAELTQARTLVVLDPAGPATTPARVTEMIEPVARGDVEFLAPRYRRHPSDGALITQLVRPLVRAVYGVGLDEPLGSEFACAGTFSSHCLEQAIWDQDAARFAIDLWLRTEAIANHFTIGQIWRPAPGAAATTLRQAVRQILMSLVACLQAHEPYWHNVNGDRPLHTSGRDPVDIPPAVEWDYQALAAQARSDLNAIRPLLEQIIEPAVSMRLFEDLEAQGCAIDDEVWVRSVYAFAIAAGRGTTPIDQLADMFVPLYLWRSAHFMSCAVTEPADAVQARLNALCDTFQRQRMLLVSGWASGEVRSS